MKLCIREMAAMLLVGLHKLPLYWISETLVVGTQRVVIAADDCIGILNSLSNQNNSGVSQIGNMEQMYPEGLFVILLFWQKKF